MKKIIYKFQYYFLMLAYKILCLFPEEKRFKFGDFLGTFTYKFIKKRRLVALTNLKMAFPGKDIKELEKIALTSFQVMMKAFLCTLWLPAYLKNEKNVKIKNEDIFLEAYKQKKGVMVALLHMGNMEASLKIAEKYPVVTVAKKQRNPYINKFIDDSRKNDLHLTVFTKSKSTSKDLIKRIHNGEIFALFSDHRDKGAKVEFFGMTAKAPTGSISLALKYDLPLLIAYNYFNPDNTCTAVIEKFDLIKTDNFKNDVLNNTQLLINRMEDIITKHPEQWMWFHDRWNLYRKLYRHKK